jgi:two-component system sensor histidine kinase BaeS
MKIGITYRLFLSILSATGLAILSLFVITLWSIDRGFYQYLSTLDQSRLERMAKSLEQAYAEHENWDFLRNNTKFWIGRLLDARPDDITPRRLKELGESGDVPPPLPPLGGEQRPRWPLIILNAERKPLFGSLTQGEEVNFRPIIHQGVHVGYVGLMSPKHFLHPMQAQFLSQQKVALALAAAGMVIVIVIISLPLSRRLVMPIAAMAAATHEIASGKYGTRIPVSSSDELGRLARDFNDMAQTLEKHEKERRQWVADISHELRTPVSVLRSEIEALLDGIRNVTPDTIRSLHAETLRLNRLVEDLYQLSLSDIGALIYRKENIDLIEVLKSTIESYRAEFDRKGIKLTSNLPQRGEVIVFADAERINQLFANLFENSLRYTDAGGDFIINLTKSNEFATIDLRDSAPGVSEQDVCKLFERLYRVEGSRSRTSGGAGLGLAICKNIVEAHEGNISAHKSPLGGLLIRITFPVVGRIA